MQAVENGQQTFSKEIEAGSLTLEHRSFEDYIQTFNPETFDYIVADLGFSSNQLEYSERGFSYLKPDELLDLRYNTSHGVPVWKKLSRMDARQIGKVLFHNSGEAYSQRFASRIVDTNRERSEQNKPPLQTVGEFTEIIEAAIPAKHRHKRFGILSRVWQGFRIWVNDEFSILDTFLAASISRLKPGGKLIIVSFHSLEDKHVTRFMRHAAQPTEVDDYGNKEQYYKLLTKKAATPTAEEIADNPRARSGILRVLEKV
jgi:16S rRNA (cytosine1402-N4)-methyltransferase